MTTPKNGGPAFPVIFDHDDAKSEFPGMSLRDWFAGMSFNQMLRWDFAEGQDYETIAREAYKAADAMLAERERKVGE